MLLCVCVLGGGGGKWSSGRKAFVALKYERGQRSGIDTIKYDT